MINRTDKLKVIDALVKAGKATSPLTTNLLTVLVENGRLGETQKVIQGFQNLMMAHRGELVVTVTSATPLDADTLTKVKEMLGKSVLKDGTVKSLKVENKVKPGILGGLVVEFGDKTIDLSVSSKVAKFSKMLNDLIG
jgi:F-type H+-transporting ATPase subunit O